MPTFILHTNMPEFDHGLETAMHSEIREIISHEIGKSKDFVLTVFHKGVSMRFGETDKSVAYCEIKNVGKLSNDTTSKMSKLICLLLSEKLMIDSKQIYIEYQESERHLWGWNGGTFA